MSSCLVAVRDSKGRSLSIKSDVELFFGTRADNFRLERAGGSSSVRLMHESGLWVALEDRKLSLGEVPVDLEFYVNLDKQVAFKVPNGNFLSSQASCGSLELASGPLRQDRANKLFCLEEVAIPSRALETWPTRCCLHTAEGVYLSDSEGQASAIVDVACCSEQLVVDLPRLVASSGAALSTSTLWSKSSGQVASIDPVTNSIFFHPQHSCMGREELLVGLSPCNQITIKHHSSSMDALAMVSCHWPAAKCSEGAKATELFLELVAGKPSLIITAHGTLVGAQRRPGTPRHSDMRLCTVPHDGLSSGGAHPAAWLLEHHGDHMYTIRNTTNGHHMYLTDQGMLSVDNSGSVDYPDPRALFTLELAWTGTNSQASTATPHHDEEFVALAAGHCIAGFTIKPFVKVDGRQLCVCALPDGRLMTAFAQRHVTRWELFTIADKEAVLDSPLELLDRLPCVPFAETARGMRRSSSCQAVFSGHQCTTPRKSMATSSSSSFLPGIREAEEEALLPDATPQPLEWKTGLQSMKGGRRCLSDSALTELPWRQTAQPKMLASLRNPPEDAAGWGVRSAASLQNMALRTLCTTLIQEISGTLPVGKKLRAAEAIKVAEQRFMDKLPEEVASQVYGDLELLLCTPEPTKLGYKQLHKAAMHGDAPTWAEGLVASEDLEEDALPEELAEASACCVCKGSTGLLLPLDPEVNPRHHGFLQAMERRQFGGVRRRRGVQRRPDAVSVGLYLAKNGLVVFGIIRCLGALLKSGK